MADHALFVGWGEVINRRERGTWSHALDADLIAR